MEAVARAICSKQLVRDGKSEETFGSEVDMYWHIVAAELEAGIIDETGAVVGGEMNWKRKMGHCQSNWIVPTLLGPCFLGLGTKTLVRLELTKQGAARNGENSPH